MATAGGGGGVLLGEGAAKEDAGADGVEVFGGAANPGGAVGVSGWPWISTPVPQLSSSMGV